jgi:Ran-binding protein 1
MAESGSKPVPVETPEAEAKAPAAKEETPKVDSVDGASDAKDAEPKSITEKAGAATSAVKDNVFSMFGGGPKKEKKDEDEEVNDRSGSSKAQVKDEVCFSP